MNQQTKLIFAIQQIENLSKLVEGNQWEGFFSSHLLPIKFELERQISLTNPKSSIKLGE